MNWEQAWLRYDKAVSKKNRKFFDSVYTEEKGTIIENAIMELKTAVKGMFEKEIVLLLRQDEEAGIVLELVWDDGLKKEGYRLVQKGNKLYVKANTAVGILYGTFALIRKAECEETLEGLEERSVPDKELRMLNHWDNTDGSIERGYSGNSFFFEKGKIVMNERTRDYARLLASVGINGTVINNVNVKAEATYFITEEYLPEIAGMAELFAGYGIRLYLSLNYAACMEIGGLSNADPLDRKVTGWWEERMKLVYRYIPNLGGFLVKADSEGRPGPFTYGRNQAQGANMLAKAIRPYNGSIIWRCFVYNCRQDWRDRKTDRARAAYDYFYDLDGKFLDNVILQIKNGPMDFQVREPFMPLFGKLKKTKHMMEVQIAQEYTGQQIDICYLIPWFKELFNTRTCCGEEKDTIGDLLGGKCCNSTGCGVAAVANTGKDENWTGHDLAAANLYGFGRIAWNSRFHPKEIANEWIKQTFSRDKEVVEKIETALMMSLPAYEKYTAPLGVGFMVTPHYHYGPNIDGYEYSPWGTYHRADHLGIGIDRSGRGTGYAGLYHTPIAKMYDDVSECPDNLLLFFHHVPYTHVLKNGKTVIQHIYDTHFEGVHDVENMIRLWNSLEAKVDSGRFERVAKRMKDQLADALEWRDQINTYFYRKSGIRDEAGRTIY